MRALSVAIEASTLSHWHPMRSIIARHCSKARTALHRSAAAQRRGVKYSSEERGGIRPSSEGRGFMGKWFGDASMWPLIIMTGGAGVALFWWIGSQADKSNQTQKAQPRALQLEQERLYKEVQERS